MKYSIILMLLVLLPGVALPNVPCDESWAEFAFTGPEPVSLLVIPDGSGDVFTNASIVGARVDATILLHVRDCGYMPIENYPREDLWLESADNGLAMCYDGTIADANTDHNGDTTWTQPLFAGGQSEALCLVIVNGAAVTNTAGFNLHFNSPDIDGNRVVNLTDIPLFAQDFHGGQYRYRSDIYYDGVINLSDVVIMGQARGRGCP